MKKALIVLIAIALIVWVISWFRTPDAVATSAAKVWPGGMGTLDKAADRFPPIQPNEASRKLAALGNALPRNEAVDKYVWGEMMRAEVTIGEPPALPDVSAIRELLLREQVVWERDPRVEIGAQKTTESRVMLLTMARALVASALAKARANDPAAWEDLRAVASLARSLDGQPVMMIQTAALAMARAVNAVAWKMPLPAPAWFAEMQQRDLVRPLLDAFQVQTASYWEDGSALFPTKMLADSVERDRQIAEQLFTMTKCDVSVPVNATGTDLTSAWRRAFRYRAEREATANALRVREGKPIEEKSACGDGTWSYDGTTLRFSREIPTGPPDAPMPLALRVSAPKP